MSLNLRGFLIRCHSPSEDSLSIIIDCSSLSGAIYLDFIRELQDVLSNIDEKYSNRTQHRRTVKARYIKYVDSRRRIIRFSPYPSGLLNRIKYLRAKLYYNIGRYCITIQRFRSGMFERNLYLLPYEYAEKLIQSINALNKEIDEINNEINEIDFRDVENILKKYNLTIPECIREISHIEVELVPFELSDKAVEEWASRSPAVARAIHEFRRSLIIDAINSIKPKLEDMIKRMLAEKKLTGIKEGLEEMKKFVEAVGLKSLAETVIEPLIEQAEGKIPLNPKISEWLEGRIESLIETL